MRRRNFLAGAAAVAAMPVVAQAQKETVVDREEAYWQAQWLINEYELERQELRAHAKIMKNARVV